MVFMVLLGFNISIGRTNRFFATNCPVTMSASYPEGNFDRNLLLGGSITH